jgi:hypothetical protein
VVDDQYKGLAKEEGFQEKNVILPLFRNLDEKMKKEKDTRPPLNKMSREEKLKELLN